MKTLYHILGLTKQATIDEIKNAYRELAKKHHPDVGGDTEKMTELTLAYNILRDPEKRKRYDETGQHETNTFKSRFTTFVQSYFLQIVDTADDVVSNNLIENFNNQVTQFIAQLDKDIQTCESKTEKLNKVLSRVKCDTDNTITIVLQAQIDTLQKQAGKCKEDKKFLKQCRAILEDYDYKTDNYTTFITISTSTL